MNDDDAETSGSEKVVSLQSESFESGDDGGSRSESRGDAESGSEVENGDHSGSGSASESDSDADGDSSKSLPTKRAKRASQA